MIAEKAWCHVANASGLGKRYDTVVETDASKLPDLLRRARCLWAVAVLAAECEQKKATGADGRIEPVTRAWAVRGARS